MTSSVAATVRVLARMALDFLFPGAGVASIAGWRVAGPRLAATVGVVFAMVFASRVSLEFADKETADNVLGFGVMAGWLGAALVAQCATLRMWVARRGPRLLASSYRLYVSEGAHPHCARCGVAPRAATGWCGPCEDQLRQAPLDLASDWVRITDLHVRKVAPRPAIQVANPLRLRNAGHRRLLSRSGQWQARWAARTMFPDLHVTIEAAYGDPADRRRVWTRVRTTGSGAAATIDELHVVLSEFGAGKLRSTREYAPLDPWTGGREDPVTFTAPPRRPFGWLVPNPRWLVALLVLFLPVSMAASWDPCQERRTDETVAGTRDLRCEEQAGDAAWKATVDSADGTDGSRLIGLAEAGASYTAQRDALAAALRSRGVSRRGVKTVLRYTSEGLTIGAAKAFRKSHVGGAPIAADGAGWPVNPDTNKPLSFLASLDLTEMPMPGLLPSEGNLLLYFDEFAERGDMVAEMHVDWVQPGTQLTARADGQSMATRRTSLAALAVPITGEVEHVGMRLDGTRDSRRVGDLMNEITDALGPHQLLGESRDWQGPVLEEIPYWFRRSVATDLRRDYSREERRGFGWTLLAQFGSRDGLEFAQGGDLYVAIPTTDLAERKFDRVVGIVQVPDEEDDVDDEAAAKTA